jgi:hypothetical protein
VVDLSSSSDEGEPILDTSRNFEFAECLFGELNHSLLEPSGGGKIIILSNSDKEEEACEETTADAKTAPSATDVRSSTPAASPANVDEDPEATPNDSSDGLTSGPKMGKDSDGRDEVGTP